MNVTWQKETTTATADVNDYYLLHLLSPNLQPEALLLLLLLLQGERAAEAKGHLFLRRNNKCSKSSLL